MRKLRPINQINYVPLTFPEPVEIPDLTPEEESSFNQKYIGIQMRYAIEAQEKLIRRNRRNPRIPKTDREKQIASYHVEYQKEMLKKTLTTA